jgi:long-subunit acyl-CoA synthetase (AMP-forming)
MDRSEATAEAFTENGYFETSDVAEYNDENTRLSFGRYHTLLPRRNGVNGLNEVDCVIPLF